MQQREIGNISTDSLIIPAWLLLKISNKKISKIFFEMLKKLLTHPLEKSNILLSDKERAGPEGRAPRSGLEKLVTFPGRISQ
jgi:hypothetical protein